MSKVTIRTIAEQAGVSVGTVDRALNGRGRINEETRLKIMEIADRLGYRPNKAASALGRQRKLRIAVITSEEPYFFYRYIREGIDDAIRDTLDYGVTVDQIKTRSLSFENQVSVIENLDVSLYDGVCINAGSDELTPYIDRIVDAGVPVVTFNSDAASSKRFLFVGEDPVKSGRMAGDMMGRLLNGKGNIIVLSSFFHPGAALSRVNSFLEALKDYPDIHVLETFSYADQVEKAYEVCREAMKRYDSIDGIFSNSATGSVATGMFISKHHEELSKRPVLIGYDVSDDVEQYLKQGWFDMAIDQEPRRQSYNAIALLYRHLTEHWVPEQRILEIRVNMVMRYNAADHAMKQIISNSVLI